MGSGAYWNWYSSSCGGTFLFSGLNKIITPTSTLTYFVRAESSCNTTLCRSITITVKDSSITPNSISATNNIICNPAETSDLTLNGGTLGTDANWFWYKNSCGGTHFIK